MGEVTATGLLDQALLMQSLDMECELIGDGSLVHQLLLLRLVLPLHQVKLRKLGLYLLLFQLLFSLLLKDFLLGSASLSTSFHKIAACTFHNYMDKKQKIGSKSAL